MSIETALAFMVGGISFLLLPIGFFFKKPYLFIIAAFGFGVVALIAFANSDGGVAQSAIGTFCVLLVVGCIAGYIGTMRAVARDNKPPEVPVKTRREEYNAKLDELRKARRSR